MNKKIVKECRDTALYHKEKNTAIPVLQNLIGGILKLEAPTVGLLTQLLLLPENVWVHPQDMISKVLFLSSHSFSVNLTILEHFSESSEIL